MTSREHDRLPGSAKGVARTSDGAQRRPARLSWTDPLTGDRLSVELWGSEAFLRSLSGQGFRVTHLDVHALEQVHGTTDAAGDGRSGGRARVRSSAEPTGGFCAGSTPPSGDAA